MGQTFYATAYDIETKTCCKIHADKFHANCYSFSGAVYSMHYLLRQKPHRIMWGGYYTVGDLSKFSSEEDLLGLSIFLDDEDLGRNVKDTHDDNHREKAKRIGENSKLWNRIDVWDTAEKYFDYENTKSVDYSRYLVNHTQKLAVNLSDYHEKSKSRIKSTGEIYVIDPVPVLTETGGGSEMAFSDGITTDTTEGLAGTWCGNLLQITDSLPDGYTQINCCFAESRGRSSYCYHKFGTNKDGLLLKNETGGLFKCVMLSLRGNRGTPFAFKIEEEDESIMYEPVDVGESD